MKILIGVDDSPCSDAAIQMVSKLRWPAKTQVTVVSAVNPATMVYSDMYVPAVGAAEAMKEQKKTHQELASRAEVRLHEAGFVTDVQVPEGEPGEAIVRAAREAGADLVVVGSHGRSGITKLLMGSVATHVVTHAPCSVLVVKAKAGRT